MADAVFTGIDIGITITVKHKTDRESYIDMNARKSGRAAFFDVFEKSNQRTVYIGVTFRYHMRRIKG